MEELVGIQETVSFALVFLVLKERLAVKVRLVFILKIYKHITNYNAFKLRDKATLAILEKNLNRTMI